MPTAPPFATLEQQQQDVVISTHILSESLFANSIKILALSSPPVSMIVFHAHFLNLVREACIKDLDVFFLLFPNRGSPPAPRLILDFFQNSKKYPQNALYFRNWRCNPLIFPCLVLWRFSPAAGIAVSRIRNVAGDGLADPSPPVHLPTHPSPPVRIPQLNQIYFFCQVWLKVRDVKVPWGF